MFFFVVVVFFFNDTATTERVELDSPVGLRISMLTCSVCLFTTKDSKGTKQGGSQADDPAGIQRLRRQWALW